MCSLVSVSRIALPKEKNWSASDLEAAAIVWAMKKNRPLFYGMPFGIHTDHKPLRNLLSLAEKVPGVQRWHDFLSTYKYDIRYKPGRVNANANMLSRLPQPPNRDDVAMGVQDTGPGNVDVYFIGASEIWPSMLKKRPRKNM